MRAKPGLFRALGLLAAASLAAHLPARAQSVPLAARQDAPVQLKLSHWVPPSHPLHAAIADWIGDIAKETGGSLTGAIFPAEQLGKAFDHYDLARDGIADAAYVNPGYQPGRFPIIALSDLPFNYRDGKAGTAAVDAWYRKYAAREMPDVHYCFAFVHDPGTLFSRRRVTLPADVRGMKIRPSDATIGAFVTLLGGNNVQASAPQSRDLLERGVADGTFFPWQSTVLFGIDKATKYAIDVQFYSSTFVWVLNKDKYEALSPGQRTAVDHHCNTEWAVRFASPWVDFEVAGRDKVRSEPGYEVIELTPEQTDQWRAAAKPLRDTWAASVRRAGGDPAAIAREFAAALAERHAAY